MNYLYPMPKSATWEQKGIIAPPQILIIDCGCWTFNLGKQYQYFGAMSGSYFVLGTLSDGKAQPLPNTIKSDALKALFGGVPGAQVIRHGVRRARPVRGKDFDKQDDLLCPKEQLYLFVPDCHIGLRDSADDFYFKNKPLEAPKSDRLANAECLSALLSWAKKCGAQIIQMGDFFDIWEGEASLAIYYEKFTTSDEGVTTGTVRTRPDRARRAASSIISTWNEPDAGGYLSNIRSAVDIFLPGNHDAEVQWLAGHDIQKSFFGPISPGGFVDADKAREPSNRRTVGSVTVVEGTRVEFPGENSDGAVVRWIAEHGHRYDESNDTSKIYSLDEMMAVYGKQVTYAWARAERDEFVAGELGPIYENVLGDELQPIDWGRGDRDPADTKWGFELYFKKLAAAGAWVGEQWNFSRMRMKLRQHLFEETKALSPDYVFSRLVLNHAPDYYCLWWKEGAAPPPKLPMRLFVHGHTHDRLIQTITFVRSPKPVEHYSDADLEAYVGEVHITELASRRQP